jgi:STE24 endopeptidase
MVAAPGVGLSAVLLLIAFGGLGRWVAVVLVVWLGVAAVLWCPPVERWAGQSVHGFRRPTVAEVTLLQPVVSAVVARCGAAAAELDWCVIDRPRPNAFAVGGRAVALTGGLRDAYRDGVLSGDQVVALLAHEVGHHVTGTSRGSVAGGWLMLPWTVVQKFLAGFVGGALRAVPLARVSLLLVPVVVGRAAAELYSGGGVAPLLLLGLLVAALFVCPPVDAAVRRGGEYAADRYVACLGMGRDLAGALTALRATPVGRRGAVARLVSDHPSVESRLARLGRDRVTGVSAFVT